MGKIHCILSGDACRDDDVALRTLPGWPLWQVVMVSDAVERRNEMQGPGKNKEQNAAAGLPFYQKAPVDGEFVHVDEGQYHPMPEPFAEGGIQWKLLHVSPELGSWTAYFKCPKGSSFAAHIHIGPGEYLLTKGKMEVRGGIEAGGETAYAMGYGYEPSGARHDKTYFPIDSEFYMTFIGPLHWINEQDGSTVAVTGWKELQDVWLQQNGKGN